MDNKLIPEDGTYDGILAKRIDQLFEYNEVIGFVGVGADNLEAISNRIESKASINHPEFLVRRCSVKALLASEGSEPLRVKMQQTILKMYDEIIQRQGKSVNPPSGDLPSDFRDDLEDRSDLINNRIILIVSEYEECLMLSDRERKDFIGQLLFMLCDEGAMNFKLCPVLMSMFPLKWPEYDALPGPSTVFSRVYAATSEVKKYSRRELEEFLAKLDAKNRDGIQRYLSASGVL